ncbi:MAG: EamA family transporter [Candidatus Kerfeldbacteria bacterium CG08_land_8_20_14_0_20_40_16]|uniref:EamA family transporter n=1 Tax=Candidatus Kerfeldbacteria bacterium CG08_land_8_20_14_0_20_40_16 TaxID=2014244 RepID=A0A2H0YU81_9BACT|nr:MAG: EamA family transporter [Candidatus Kerfeldbacteria bacterium CG08_land_8_20_14_0_20_40_16]
MDYSWIIFALLSAITAALVAVFGKIGLTGIDTNTATTIRAIIMALFLIGLIAIQGKLGNIKPIIANHKALFYIILSGLAGALSWLFYFVALRKATVHQIVPLDRLSIVFALLLAFFILGEKISPKAGIGAALVVIGGILIALG